MNTTRTTGPAPTGDPATSEAPPRIFPMLDVPRPIRLQRLGERLNRSIGAAGTIVVEHPVETRLLQVMSREELQDFARSHGLHVVRRVGGRLYQFTRRDPEQ